MVLARPRRDLHAIAQQFIDRTVHVEGDPGMIASSALQVRDSASDQRLVISALEEGAEQAFLDISVVRPVMPVAQIAVAKGVLEKRNDALLSGPFPLPDCHSAHRASSSRCIIPAFIARALVAKVSASSAQWSMSSIIRTMATCSPLDGNRIAISRTCFRLICG